MIRNLKLHDAIVKIIQKKNYLYQLLCIDDEYI